MSALRLVAGLVFAAVAVFGVLRLGQRRGHGRFDLGTVSDRWRAEQRGNPQDPVF
jgi:hypothetical protein